MSYEFKKKLFSLFCCCQGSMYKFIFIKIKVTDVQKKFKFI